MLLSRYPSTHLPSTRSRPALLPRLFCTRREADQPISSPDASARADRSLTNVSQTARNHLYAAPFREPIHHISLFAFTRLGRICQCFPPPALALLLYGFSKDIVECPGILHELKCHWNSRKLCDIRNWGLERKHPLFHRMNKFKSNANSYDEKICDHVSLGSTVSQTVKGKLSLGMRVIQAGGRRHLCRTSLNFCVLLDLFRFLFFFALISQHFQCSLLTTVGLIPGLLFISSENIAFRSNRCIKLTSSGETARVPYKRS